MGVCKWISRGCNSAPARDASFRSREVSCFGLDPLACAILGLTYWRRSLIGNYYSFMNQHQKEARLFFTQGCVPGEGGSAPQTGSKGAVQETESDPDSGPSAPPAAKTRGRPKGKQKAGK